MCFGICESGFVISGRNGRYLNKLGAEYTDGFPSHGGHMATVFISVF